MLIKSECQALDKTRHKPTWNLFEQHKRCKMARVICRATWPLDAHTHTTLLPSPSTETRRPGRQSTSSAPLSAHPPPSPNLSLSTERQPDQNKLITVNNPFHPPKCDILFSISNKSAAPVDSRLVERTLNQAFIQKGTSPSVSFLSICLFSTWFLSVERWPMEPVVEPGPGISVLIGTDDALYISTVSLER